MNIQEQPITYWEETLQTYKGEVKVSFMRCYEKAGFYFDKNGERYGNAVNLDVDKRMLEQWEIIRHNAIETYEAL